MAISCGAPAYMVSKEFLLDQVRPRLIALVSELETSLGTVTAGVSSKGAGTGLWYADNPAPLLPDRGSVMPTSRPVRTSLFPSVCRTASVLR